MFRLSSPRRFFSAFGADTCQSGGPTELLQDIKALRVRRLIEILEFVQIVRTDDHDCHGFKSCTKSSVSGFTSYIPRHFGIWESGKGKTFGEYRCENVRASSSDSQPQHLEPVVSVRLISLRTPVTRGGSSLDLFRFVKLWFTKLCSIIVIVSGRSTARIKLMK